MTDLLLESGDRLLLEDGDALLAEDTPPVVTILGPPPRWLAATVETHDGRSLNFGPEESPDRLALEMSFSTSLPGGFGGGRLVVARPDGVDPPDIQLFAPVRFYGAGGRTAYEGRVAAKPHFGANEIEITLEGPAAAFGDDLFRYFYVSRDLSRWGAPSVQRRLNLLDVDAPHQSDAQAITDETGGPALRMAVTGEWDGTDIIPRCEAWFDAGSGLEIAYVAGEFDGWGDADWQLFPFSADDDVTPIPGSDVYTSGTGEGTFLSVPTVPHRWAGLNWHYGLASNPSGRADFEFGVNVRKLAAYGSAGLPLYDADDGGAQGVRGDDVLRHALGLGAPGIPIDYIEPAIFAMPEAVFDAWDGRLSHVIERVTLLGGAQDKPNDWGIYEHGFFWRSPGSYGQTHRVRLDENVPDSDEGEESLEVADAIVATYTNAAGESRAVGFPGSGADTESDLLVDTDPANPVAFSGLPRRVITRDVGRTSAEGAIILGRLALREAIATARIGEYTVSALADDEPSWLLRAGDRAFVEDGYGIAQPVAQTDYDHGSGNNTATIGRPVGMLDVFLAELAA